MNLTLTFLNGELEARSFEFRSPREVIVGRAPTCDLVVFDTKVSRNHCKLVLREGGVEIVDLGSVNGTLVNGAPVTQATLTHGDRIQLADTSLGVELCAPGRTERMSAEGVSRTSSARLRDGAVVEIRGYELVRCLGEGAFGAVFEAHNDKGERVALKLAKLRENFSSQDRLRFLREAETAASLLHPNVVRVLDRGQSGPTLFIALEFVPGETLQALLSRQGPFPVNAALHLGRQIASALECARTANIVHRDVKPDNVMVRADGVAKLADFGFAKCMLTAGRSGLTTQGDVVGTVAYMSPEQLASSIHADHRSDIYSLGATLFHALTGCTPFSARTNFDYFKKILTEEAPRVDHLRPEIPPFVGNVVARCLRKDPADRFQTAGELGRVLDQLLAGAEHRTTVA